MRWDGHIVLFPNNQLVVCFPEPNRSQTQPLLPNHTLLLCHTDRGHTDTAPGHRAAEQLLNTEAVHKETEKL